ncbi:hypothetical protein DOT_4632 [Desulfosporosinus sp. OT]|nr:hypothetical protein DOT_4632 [Desulfosporosinus sp. OT]
MTKVPSIRELLQNDSRTVNSKQTTSTGTTWNGGIFGRNGEWSAQSTDQKFMKQRFDEILETINSRNSLLKEFGEEIFNALDEKIEILTQRILFLNLRMG